MRPYESVDGTWPNPRFLPGGYYDVEKARNFLRLMNEVCCFLSYAMVISISTSILTYGSMVYFDTYKVPEKTHLNQPNVFDNNELDIGRQYTATSDDPREQSDLHSKAIPLRESDVLAKPQRIGRQYTATSDDLREQSDLHGQAIPLRESGVLAEPQRVEQPDDHVREDVAPKNTAFLAKRPQPVREDVAPKNTAFLAKRPQPVPDNTHLKQPNIGSQYIDTRIDLPEQSGPHIVLAKPQRVDPDDHVTPKGTPPGYGWFRTLLKAKVREGADLNSTLVAGLPAGASVYVTHMDSNRAHISSPVTGWVSLQTTEGLDVLHLDKLAYTSTKQGTDWAEAKDDPHVMVRVALKDLHAMSKNLSSVTEMMRERLRAYRPEEVASKM